MTLNSWFSRMVLWY